jgi:MFS family permease
VLTRPWAAVERRIGARRVLVATSVFLSLDFLVYGFLAPTTLWLLPVSAIVASVGNSGFWICILPYRYKLMPSAGKTIYEAWNGTFYAAAGLLGALAGGQAQRLFQGGFETPFLSFGNYQVVFLGCGVCAVVVALLFGWRSRRDGGSPDAPEPSPGREVMRPVPESDAAGSGIPTESSPSPS